MRLVLRLWHDDCGSGLITAEWLFLMAVMVIGLTAGLVHMRDTVRGELQDTADTVSGITQGFRLSARKHAEAAVAGTSASDSTRSTAADGTSASTDKLNLVPTE